MHLQSEAFPATTPGDQPVHRMAREAALATRARMIFPATVVMSVLAVAAGLSVPYAAISLSAVATKSVVA